LQEFVALEGRFVPTGMALDGGDGVQDVQ